MGSLGRGYAAPELFAKVGKPIVPALTAALKNPDLYVREDAVKALARMKPLTPEAQSALMNRAQGQEPQRKIGSRDGATKRRRQGGACRAGGRKTRGANLRREVQAGYAQIQQETDHGHDSGRPES